MRAMTFNLRLGCILTLAVASLAATAQEDDQWTILLHGAAVRDAAIELAVADLVETGAAHGIAFSVDTSAQNTPMRRTWMPHVPRLEFSILDEDALPEGNVILVQTHMELRTPAAGGQRYAIQERTLGDRRVLLVAGGGPIGAAYGLYWVRDRLRVHKHLPEFDVVRTPRMPVRMGAAWHRHGYGGSTQEQMHAALRHSINWVAGPGIPDLVPWNAEPEATRNAENRARARELIAHARALHMNYFSFGNEFVFHPSLLEEHNATLDPCDPAFWDAVQDKFRKLFTALPELRGVTLCLDDLSGFWDDYRPYDLLRETPECDWSCAQRHRVFMEKVMEVMLEFNKTLFQFTWGLTSDGQHVQPAVFREIFQDTVPTDNLYVMPKVTMADRWWFQPYNATFNLTPHETVVLFEPMNYYESGRANIFPTFSGQYFQGGLQTFLLPEDTNLRGAASLAGSIHERWDTIGAYNYVLYRLMWDPDEDITQIARDFCAIHFGVEAAEVMAEIYLSTPAAYKYGLHIEPISYGQFNSFLHMRVGTFPVEGYPAIDGGREHLEFLRWIHNRAKPWKRETLLQLDHGLAVAAEMRARFEDAREAIPGEALVQDLENRLDMTHNLIATNNRYVRLIFAYFDQFDAPSATHEAALRGATEDLAEVREDFVNTPGFGYELFGVDQLLANARALLDEPEATRTALERAPTRAQLQQTIAQQQQRYREVLEEYADDLEHVLDFQAIIDGQDLLHVRGGEHHIEHLRWDHPHDVTVTFHQPLPREEVTVVVRDLYSRPLHPFILEQPTAANDFTVQVYIDDAPGGQDWFRFQLYYLPGPPQHYGLAVPWQE